MPEAISQNAILANVPATTPDVVFSVTSPFNFTGTGVTGGTRLGSGAAFNVVENTPGTLVSLMRLAVGDRHLTREIDQASHDAVVSLGPRRFRRLNRRLTQA